MKRVVKGVNDLFTTNPELKQRWDFSKNSINPETISRGANVKVWWICEKGHSFQCNLSNYVLKKTDCPYCHGRKPIEGINDLETLYPNIAKEWDYEKNGNNKPSDFLPNNSYNAWWICPQGHSYQTTIVKRTQRNNGCPYCSGHRVLSGFNDLFTTNPELRAEWDYEKNEIDPLTISKGSSLKAWWICPQGHSYLSSPNNRTSKNGNCPYCSNTKVIIGVNDLETLYPELAKEWHPTKNGDLKPSEVFARSGKKVWWLCKYGHEWEQSPHLRTAGRGCPICSNEIHVSFPEKAIYFYIHKYFKEVLSNYNPGWNYSGNIDIFLPLISLGIEYDGKHWHKDIERDIIKDNLCKNNGISLIRVREEGCPILNDGTIQFFTNESDLEKTIFELITYIANLTNKKIKPSIDLKRDRTKVNELVISSEKRDNITITHPNIAKEWDYEKNGFLKPEFVTYGSTKKVWWKCSNGHEWLASVSNRCRLNRGCPYCSGNKVIIGENDVFSANPSLKDWWDYSKNIIDPLNTHKGSGKKVWWKCPSGHSFELPIRDMVKNPHCVYCDNTKLIIGYNDLATTHPKLVDEWDFEKNDILPSQVTKGSSVKVWWKCPKGHSYMTSVQSRAIYNTGCPVCHKVRIISGINDLETLYPDIALDFDYEKNKPLLPSNLGTGITKKIWWKCHRCGYEWEAAINWRTKGHGCPKCNEGVKKK